MKLAGSEPSASTVGQNIEVRVSSDESARARGIEGISFQVQRTDWHVNQLTLSFADATFQIVEEGSAIMDWREVPDDVAAQLEPAVAKRDTPVIATPVAASVNLDDLEMSVRFSLHRLDADLGENIDIAARPPDHMVVNAWDASPERREQLVTLFADKPGVQLDFQPPAASTKPAKALARYPAAEALQSHDPGLEQLFQGTVTLENYTRAVVDAGNIVLEHLYALRSLAARWPAEKDGALSPGARSQLSAMVGDHARNIRAGLSGWEGQMDPLLKGFNYQVSDADSSDIADWRTAAVSGLAAARRTDKTLR